MNKTIVKWVLSQQEELVIYNLAIATGCKVKGFREITRNNVKQLRSQIINELQKTTKAARLKTWLQKHMKDKFSKEVIEELQQKSQDELLELVDTDQYDLADVILVLMTGEPEHLAKAEALFEWRSAQEDLAKDEPQTDAEAGAAAAVEMVDSNTRVQQWEEQLAQARNKASQLEEALKELREKRKEELQEWKKERKSYTEEIKKIKQDVTLKNEQVIKQEKEMVELKDQAQKLREELERLADENEKNKAEASKRLSLQDLQSVAPIPAKVKVVLLGEGLNESLLNSSKYAFEMVGNNQIEDFLKRDLGSDAEVDEIWMLAFQISPSKQRKLRKVFMNKSFKEFATFVELQGHMNKK